MKTVPGLTDAQQADVIARNGGVETSSIPPLRLHVVDVPADSVDAALAAYRADPDVETADRDRVREAEGTPNDPGYVDQWALPQIAWDQAFGVVDPVGSSTIAVLDTGVEDAVADIPVTGGWSAFGTDPLDDPNGHGTALASIGSAVTDNADGIAGVAYDGVTVQSVQVLDAGGLGQDSDIITGVVWAAQNGADVILMGFSNPGFSSALQDAVDYAWSQGAVLVAATGNDGSSSPTYPAGDAKVVGVSATDQADALASFSNYGADTFLAAPGVGVSALGTNGATTTLSGTSASAAVVAGGAALLDANDPGASNGVIVGRLARNADPAGTADQTGNGRLNLARALDDTSTEEVVPVGAPGGGPIVGPYVAAARNVNIMFAGTGGGSVTVSVVSSTGGTLGFQGPTCPGSTVNSTTSITVTQTCNLQSSDNGATVNLSASPNATSTFGGWSPTIGTCSGTTTPCSLGVLSGGQTNITATFNAAPDLTATKTNDTSGSVVLGSSFTWNVRVKNESTATATATFTTGQTILTDNLPVGPTYGATTVTTSGTTGAGTISCSISGGDDLTCTASGGAVTFPVGSFFDVSFSVTPASTTTLNNPRASGICRADPNTVVSESNEVNNDCTTNTVTVTAGYTVLFQPPIDGSTVIPDHVVVNKGKNGKVIPVRVKIYLNGVEVTPENAGGDITIEIVKKLNTCTSPDTTDVIEEYAAGNSNTDNIFRWVNGFWVYNWDTRASNLTVGGCYRINVWVGTTKATVNHYALFMPTR